MRKSCQLLHRNLLITEECGTSKFREFHRDEDQMARLFEDLVRNFYRIRTGFRVKREDINWRWIATDTRTAALLP